MKLTPKIGIGAAVAAVTFTTILGYVKPAAKSVVQFVEDEFVPFNWKVEAATESGDDLIRQAAAVKVHRDGLSREREVQEREAKDHAAKKGTLSKAAVDAAAIATDMKRRGETSRVIDGRSVSVVELTQVQAAYERDAAKADADTVVASRAIAATDSEMRECDLSIVGLKKAQEAKAGQVAVLLREHAVLVASRDSAKARYDAKKAIASAGTGTGDAATRENDALRVEAEYFRQKAGTADSGLDGPAVDPAALSAAAVAARQ